MQQDYISNNSLHSKGLLELVSAKQKWVLIPPYNTRPNPTLTIIDNYKSSPKERSTTAML